MPWSSNATFLVTRRREAPTARPAHRHLQAPARRAPAVGLPTRACTAGRSRRTASARRWASASCRRRSARDGAARRGLAAVVRRRRPRAALLHDVRAAARPARPAAADRRVRPPRQQHRPQERPLLLGRGRPHLGDRPRAVLLRRLQAAHGHLGVRRRAHARAPVAAVRRARRPRAAGGRRRCSTTTRSRRCTSGPRWLAEHGGSPSTTPATATPGRLCERASVE